MKNIKTVYSYFEVRKYLTSHYSPVFRKGNNDYFYNSRTNDYLFMTADPEKEFTLTEIEQFFKDGSSDLPPTLELARFKIFISKNNKK